MSKHVSPEAWEPGNRFLSTKTSDKIIKETKKNLSVLAGPGSGKTEILAQRANFLLQTGLCKSPQKILALSFKVDAAANIKKRVEMRCERDLLYRFDASTFDAFFLSIVHRFHFLLPDWINLPHDFEVYPFDRNWWTDYERTVLNGKPCEYKNSYAPLSLSVTPDDGVLKIWDYCAEQKVADYDMCRSMALTIVKTRKQVRNLILSTYKYLFLDEFQDTSTPQYSFLETIFKDSDTVITAVGDTNQMIMGWAGANPKNFDNLKTDFASDIIHLAVNHRSNPKIVSLINHVIKDLTPSGEKPVVYEGTRKASLDQFCLGAKAFTSIRDEASYIAKYINSIIQKNSALMPNDFCLILRQQAKEYHEEANQYFEENGLALRNEDKLIIKNGIKIQDLMGEPLSELWVLLVKKHAGLIEYMEEKNLELIASSLTGYQLSEERDYKKLKMYIDDLIACIDFTKPVEEIISNILEIIGSKKIKTAFPQYRSQYLNKVKKSLSIFFQECLKANPKKIKKFWMNMKVTVKLSL